MFIVSTSINSPTEATLKFREIAKRRGWVFVMVGDKKTPHHFYENLQNDSFVYLNPDFQEKEYPNLSNILGWNTIQRRNIGFVFSYNQGARKIATVDDDNIPYDTWGQDSLIGQNISVDIWHNTSVPTFDCYSVTNASDICWQRGYPLDYVRYRKNIEYKGKKIQKVLIQNNLPDGDPDIDAINRLVQRPIVKFDAIDPYSSDQLSIFNSQNTLIDRSIFPYYSVWPYLGRFDDLAAGIYAQYHTKTRPVFCKSSVYQDRNQQDLITNLEKEIVGYRYFPKFLENCDPLVFPAGKDIVKFLNIYEESFK